jgi:hypothetical protein
VERKPWHFDRANGTTPKPIAKLTILGLQCQEPLVIRFSNTPSTVPFRANSPPEIVLCEIVRFAPGEKANDPELAKRMASLCDVFVMDAFATAHRAQASTEGVARQALGLDPQERIVLQPVALVLDEDDDVLPVDPPGQDD